MLDVEACAVRTPTTAHALLTGADAACFLARAEVLVDGNQSALDVEVVRELHPKGQWACTTRRRRRCVLSLQGPERSDSDADGGALDAEAVRELHFGGGFVRKGSAPNAANGASGGAAEAGEPDPERRRTKKEARCAGSGSDASHDFRAGTRRTHFQPDLVPSLPGLDRLLRCSGE